MSNALAIASVTAVLKHWLENALSEHPGSAPFGGTVPVSALAPDLIKNGENEIVRLNLFLYQVAPNAGWRNVALPSSDHRGQRLSNPPLALDLYYLLTAYGQKDFEAEILLGYAMQVLHETPVMSREAIRASLKQPAAGGVVDVPPAVKALENSDLANQVELIKLTPQSMTTEETSKLWTAFQASYRPSVAYHASVVLIDGQQPARSPLPVLTRGKPDPITGRDEGVTVQPNLLPPYPSLQEVVPPKQQPAVRMGDVLKCVGHHLEGDTVLVRFRHARSAQSFDLPALAGATATGFEVQIPLDPAPAPQPAADSPQNPDNWRAGVYVVSAVIQRAGQPDRLTNELPLTLAPSVSVTPNVAGEDVTLTATVRPKVRKTQRAVLVLADRELLAEPITVDKTDTLIFKAKTKDLPTGEQWFRLRVDGIESILVDRTKSLPSFDTTQRVTI